MQFILLFIQDVNKNGTALPGLCQLHQVSEVEAARSNFGNDLNNACRVPSVGDFWQVCLVSGMPVWFPENGMTRLTRSESCN
jgi:hypothetical protein